MSTPGPGPKYWIGFSYIRSKDYELYLNFDGTEMKSKPYHSFDDKVKLFPGNFEVI